MAKTVNLLAFDFGASSGRAILGRFDGERIGLEEVYRFPNEPVWVNEHFYWDMLRLWHEVKTGLRKALSLGIEISAIGVDTWGVDYGLLDKKGRLLANPHHYRDQRTVPVMRDLIARYGADYLYQRSGVQFMSFNTIFQLGDDLQNQPELMNLTDKILLMPDLFNYLLTGEEAAEFSIASTTGMMNIGTRSWDPDLLQTIGLAAAKLPPVVPSGTRIGSLSHALCAELGCPAIPVVAVAGHDTASAIAAAPLAAARAAFLSSGTWSLLGVECEAPTTTAAARQLDFTNEGGLDYAALLFKNINALWFIQECRRIWRQKNPELSFADISQAAQAAGAGAGGRSGAPAHSFASLVNVSEQRFFAPLDMAAEIRQFCGETGQAVPGTMGEIARCVYDSLALEYRSVADKLHQLTGERLTTVHIVGGGSQDEFLSQLTADALKVPVTAGPVEATALGNLMIQAMSIGAISGRSELRSVIQRSFSVREYQPRPNPGWDEAYPRYLKLAGGN